MSIYQYSKISNTLIQESPSEDLGIVVCIPCYNEDALDIALESLIRCDQPVSSVEVIVLINDTTDVSTAIALKNQATYALIQKKYALRSKNWLKIFPIYVQDMPTKTGGVGLARKLAMDEAYIRLMTVSGVPKIIACYDADCTCDPYYFNALNSFFVEYKKLEACSVGFAHPLDDINSNEIINYESHLRYFINMQRSIKLPFAIQTVGSSMAVTAKGYQESGGMNKRKAGEDFYFLQKFISNFKCGELNTTTIYPSSRESNRVPFGTGKAISDMIDSVDDYLTYNPESFLILKGVLQKLPEIYEQEEPVVLSQITDNQLFAQYLESIDSLKNIEEIKRNTSNYPAFYKRFYQWFNAFRLMKYLHYMRDHGYPNMPIDQATHWLLQHLDLEIHSELKQRLIVLREYDSQSNYAKLVQRWPNF